MQPERGKSLSRRLLLGTTVFVVFVLCDLALFGWLIFRSLSQREISRVIIEAREEAEELAEQIAGEVERQGHDLYTAIATESDAQTYIDSVLSQRDIVETVEIFDDEQRLVFRSERRERQGEAPEIASNELAPEVVTKRFDRRRLFERVEVPVGNIGTFVIGISRTELEARLAALRRELVRQASVIGSLTIALFATAYFLIWRLMRRSQRLEEQAQEAERMAYVGTLASGLAHEIRSPLNSLNLNMQMLEEEAELEEGPKSGRRLMAITRSEISRLERLVNDFLTYARPPALDLEEVRAVSLLEHARAVLEGQIQAQGLKVEIVDESESARVAVDRSQMNQLLLNLVQNALEATRELGRAGKITLEAHCNGADVTLVVSDNGIGLSEEDSRHIFELFYSKRKGGTGLGLAIVDRIARAHEGTMKVTSTPGEGTRMVLVLRAVGEHHHRADSPAMLVRPASS